MVSNNLSITHHRYKNLCNDIKQITDPEIPVITIFDLGILRDIILKDGNRVKVNITPTYSGCPAVDTIEKNIYSLKEEYPDFELKINRVLSPAWSSSMVTKKGRIALENYGIAPPQKNNAITLIKCPRCRSSLVTLISEFSSTSCKSMLRCEKCQEPFEYFKHL